MLSAPSSLQLPSPIACCGCALILVLAHYFFVFVFGFFGPFPSFFFGLMGPNPCFFLKSHLFSDGFLGPFPGNSVSFVLDCLPFLFPSLLSALPSHLHLFPLWAVWPTVTKTPFLLLFSCVSFFYFLLLASPPRLPCNFWRLLHWHLHLFLLRFKYQLHRLVWRRRNSSIIVGLRSTSTNACFVFCHDHRTKHLEPRASP